MSQENTKHDLRTEALRHRSRMHYDIEDTDNVLNLFLEKLQPKSKQSIASYWPQKGEFDTHPIMEHIINNDMICALPCIQKNSRILKFARWDSDTPMKKGAFDITEPDNQDFLDPDIILVPLLAFDRQGHRLGYGKGYYDATLQNLRAKKNIIAIGLAYAQQACLFNLPSEAHDEKMDWVITPQEAHYFGK